MLHPHPPPLHYSLPLLLLVSLVAVHSASHPPYSPEYLAAHYHAHICTIPVLHSLTHFHDYFPSHPFILRSLTSTPAHLRFSALSSPLSLLSSFAPFNVTLATANTYSHAKRSVPFTDYMTDILHRPVSLSDSPDDTWYWFGDHDDPSPASAAADEETAPTSLPALLSLYPLPSYALNLSSPSPSSRPTLHSVIDLPPSRYDVRLSFGVGATFSGTPAHFHSSVFAHVLHGRKRWFLYPPAPRGQQPPAWLLRPELSAIQWVEEWYRRGGGEERAGLKECVCEAGDVIFIPDAWMHATLNLEISVFVSMFTRDKGADWEEVERQWKAQYG